MAGNISLRDTRVFTQSSNFFEQLSEDVKQARSSIYIQCMSFEADETGNKLIEILISKPTVERILLIDSYSKYVVNDTFLPGPASLFNKNDARKERQALNPLLDRARQNGIKIKFTNPMGFLLWKYPARNHKKLVLVDDNISYVGGVNFTDHNFEWRDLMVRHTSKKINTALTTSFKNDFYGKESKAIHQIDANTQLFVLNGYKSKEALNPLLAIIKKASKVVVVSPYISYPFLDAVAHVKNNKVILPRNNNKGYINFIHQLGRYKNVNYNYFDGQMMHMKLMLIDDKTAIYGSSNFDAISYFFEKEILIQNTNIDLVQHLTSVALKLIK